MFSREWEHFLRVVGQGVEAEPSFTTLEDIMSETLKKKKKSRNGNRNIHLEKLRQITKIISERSEFL